MPSFTRKDGTRVTFKAKGERAPKRQKAAKGSRRRSTVTKKGHKGGRPKRVHHILTYIGLGLSGWEALGEPTAKAVKNHWNLTGWGREVAYKAFGVESVEEGGNVRWTKWNWKRAGMTWAPAAMGSAGTWAANRSGLNRRIPFRRVKL